MAHGAEKTVVGLNYGSHFDTQNITAPITRIGEGMLRTNPEGKIVVFFERADLIEGSTEHLQGLMEQGEPLFEAYRKTSNWSGGLMRASLGIYDEVSTTAGPFERSWISAVSSLRDDYPERVGILLEESTIPDAIDSMRSGATNQKYRSSIFALVQEGNLGNAAEFVDQSTEMLFANTKKRDPKIHGQLIAAAMRPDVIGVTGQLGPQHSQRVSKAMQERGLAVQSHFHGQDENGTLWYDPLEVVSRMRYFGDIPEHMLYQAAIGFTVAGLVYSRIAPSPQRMGKSAWFAQHAVRDLSSMEAITLYDTRQQLVGPRKALELQITSTISKLGPSSPLQSFP